MALLSNHIYGYGNNILGSVLGLTGFNIHHSNFISWFTQLWVSLRLWSVSFMWSMPSRIFFALFLCFGVSPSMVHFAHPSFSCLHKWTTWLRIVCFHIITFSSQNSIDIIPLSCSLQGCGKVWKQSDLCPL